MLSDPIKKVLMVITIIIIFFLTAAAGHAQTLGICKTETGTGWLERSDQGDLILHLEGSYYDMGYQHGKLLEDEGRLSLRAIKTSIRKEMPLFPLPFVTWYLHTFIYKKQAAFIPGYFKEEMLGAADATGVSLRQLQAYHALTYITSCATAAAWGQATKRGELLFMRTNDTFFSVDPETNTMVQELGMIVIYRPLTGVPYMMISWPGYLGASDGMNAEGIAVGNMSNRSKYESPAGLPMMFRLKKTLNEAKTLEQAAVIMTQTPFGGGYNFIVADAKIPEAYVIEMDAKRAYIGAWNGAAESNSYTFQGRKYTYEPTQGLLIRTNHPLSDELIAHHEGSIDISDEYDCRSGPRYRVLRKGLLEQYGDLYVLNMLTTLRTFYQGLYQGQDDPCFVTTTHQMVLCPQNGDILISFAKGNPDEEGLYRVSAYMQDIHKYNFFELLDRSSDQH